MIPCLYSKSETAFDSNGIGKLYDCISCNVTEKRNSSYELEMEYPADGIHAEGIVEDAIILAKPAYGKQSQPFYVYKITKQLSGVLQINARHISYRLNYNTVSPFTASSCEEAMSQVGSSVSVDEGFTFETDIDSDASFTLSAPGLVRSCIGGSSNSLISVYGGELEWDRFNVILHQNRGADNGVRLAEGKNLIDLSAASDTDDTITGYHPYWSGTDDDGNDLYVELSEKVVVLDSSAAYQKIEVLDCSSEFDDEPTEDELREYAEAYLAENASDTPAIDISVDFEQLTDDEISAVEGVNLCDTVYVHSAKAGVDISCKVTETAWDVLLERYSGITLSNAEDKPKNQSLEDTLGSISDTADSAYDAATSSSGSSSSDTGSSSGDTESGSCNMVMIEVKEESFESYNYLYLLRENGTGHTVTSPTDWWVFIRNQYITVPAPGLCTKMDANSENGTPMTFTVNLMCCIVDFNYWPSTSSRSYSPVPFTAWWQDDETLVLESSYGSIYWYRSGSETIRCRIPLTAYQSDSTITSKRRTLTLTASGGIYIGTWGTVTAASE
ncbi:MAG: phage tail protein [Clostridiales bacterium]|nr:phage tail protein [Clostridiales bacterium]